MTRDEIQTAIQDIDDRIAALIRHKQHFIQQLQYDMPAEVQGNIVYAEAWADEGFRARYFERYGK